MSPFPWSDAMQFGFGVLRLSSKDFWAMTPRELFAAYMAFQPTHSAPIERETLNDLIRQFPDIRD